MINIKKIRIPTLLKRKDELKNVIENYGIITEQDYIKENKFIESLPDKIRPNNIAQTDSSNSVLPHTKTNAIKLQNQNTPQIKRVYSNDYSFQNNVNLKTYQFGGFEWYVISQASNSMTLLSKYKIAIGEYSRSGVSWEYSSIRKWLNESFYNEFSLSDKAKICMLSLDNNNSAATNDYIYLLGEQEARCVEARNLSCNSWWWLRASESNNSVLVVSPDGIIKSAGPSSILGVRPVITIKR